jgi:DNA replication protein DnaC
MQTKYNVSVNIQRDADRDIHYIPTINAERVVNQISNDFKKGTRSFTIVGSYGTGKSSFLWALQQTLQKKKKIFKNDINLLSNPSVGFINIVGDYGSIREVFADEFGVKVNRNLAQNLLSEIYNRYHDLGKKNPILVIVIDEFGKFLEYASQNNPEEELYFIQQLAEFANNDDHNIILLTTVHQNLDAYANSLGKEQRLEWTKVKGRFREITFNEPVEQLLFLAAKHIEDSKLEKKNVKEFDKAIEIFKKAKAFNISERYVESIAEKLFPLDLTSANVLILALQRYGQNERSLFSFLESTDHTGMLSFNSTESPFYSIANVYDYLVYNFYSFINSKNNPDYSSWSSIKSALERVESTFQENTNSYLKLIKTIGLTNLLASKGSSLDRSFIEGYAKVCLGISKPAELINSLESFKIIIYRKYDKRFVVYEGTDLDIQSALIEAGNKINEISDITTLLKKYIDLPAIMAKEHAYKRGTPRLFEYRVSDVPIMQEPVGEIDGFINLVFNEKNSLDLIEYTSKQSKKAILYGSYKNTRAIKDLLFEIEKTQKVIEENIDDKVAKRELENILQHQKNFLNHKLLNNFYSNGTEIAWYYCGKDVTDKIISKRSFNSFLSKICDVTYSFAPIFNNELINRHKISASIGSAKKNYLKALSLNWGQVDLGFNPENFPAEKTIYLALLKQNGLQPEPSQINFNPQVPENSSFRPLWDASIEFLNSAKANRRSVTEFIEVLSHSPFKLKQGLIDFWVPSFLFIKRDDYALFGEKAGYIPDIEDETLELIVKEPAEYEIKAFDIEGVKLDVFNSYRVLLDQPTKGKVSNQTFIETIKPFIKFYRDLPEYSRNTKRLGKESHAIRDAITRSKDPEHIFFEDFPQALGYSISKLQASKTDLADYTKKLQKAIKELRNSYEELVNRFEGFIQDDIIGETIPFEEYQEALQKRYKKLRVHLLLPNQKTFILRLNSALPDRNAWLNSLAQATVGNTLEKLKDEEEPMLFDKLKSMVLELDTLTTLSKSDFVEDKEDVIGLEISTFNDGVNKKVIRLPKNKRKEVQSIEQLVKKQMSSDKTVNMVALANILKELFKR